MSDWERRLANWEAAQIIDQATAERIRAYENSRPRSLRLPVVIALAFGGLLVAAGILLFVSAHWDRLSPGERMSLIVLLIGGLHVAGALTAERFPAFGVTLHALGTVALGAGIFLAGQIFQLEENWPEGILLWAAGAWIGFLVLHSEAQLAFAAILTPAWIVAKWATGPYGPKIVTAGLFLLALAYLTSPRKVLIRIGTVTLLPVAVLLVQLHVERTSAGPLAGWILALALPTAVAFAFRKREAWKNAIAALWVAALLTVTGILVYLWCAISSIGLVMLGLAESRSERINLGIAGFALTVIVFYFSNVMDKLGRSASLMALGILFLAGGWLLERLRRRLVARVREALA